MWKKGRDTYEGVREGGGVLRLCVVVVDSLFTLTFLVYRDGARRGFTN